MDNDVDRFLAARAERKRKQQQWTQYENVREAKARELFATSGKAEWERLRELTKTLAVGKDVDGKPFTWRNWSLVLENVAATFMTDMEIDGILEGCEVMFGRIPYTSYAGESPIAVDVWTFDFHTQDGAEILWVVNGTLFRPADIASKIVTRLVEYHDEYEAAYGR